MLFDVRVTFLRPLHWVSLFLAEVGKPRGEEKTSINSVDMAAMSFAVHFKYVAMVALIGFSLAGLSDGCTLGDCEVNQVCCHSQCVYGSSCLGQYCSSDSDCSSGESCCRQSCVSSSSCEGRFCSFDSDCSMGESCCSSHCFYSSDCIGLSCSFSSDCGSWETCCHGSCQNVNDSCVNGVVVIASSVIVSLVFICMISICIFYARRRRRTLGQTLTATTATTTRCATQGNPPYQQGHPYHPLPQSEQHQTANHPPYKPGTMVVGEQPPPYPTEPHRASGGVYAPKTSYGAMQSTPAV